MLKGRDVMIYRDDVLIAGTRANELQVGCETIEIASETTADWREYVAGRKDWQMSVSTLLSTTADLEDALTIGTVVRLVFRDREGTGGVQGRAIVEQYKATANVGDIVKGSFQFKGTGALTRISSNPLTE